jgi:hypothetical protein
MLAGSTAQSVILRADCPVIAVKPKRGSTRTRLLCREHE